MTLTKKLAAVALVLLASALLLPAGEEKADAAKGPTKAVAVLHPTKDSKVHGVITFTVEGDAVHVAGKIEGLSPGEHGFHVHEFGDVSSADGMATGGHFDSDKHMHGAEDAGDRHTGDLGNIKAGDDGVATIDKTDKVIKLSGPNSIVGRGLIVHAKKDDYSQPTGNAGGRVAQGVIGVAKSAAAPK
ncbi:MAG TPA: superoxide dismutase family protein [Gemmataceae bacterium]|nr:superoxide dismutase family protein [Gemmataceae bacterium]